MYHVRVEAREGAVQRWRWISLVVAALALALSGCGGSGGVSTGSPDGDAGEPSLPDKWRQFEDVAPTLRMTSAQVSDAWRSAQTRMTQHLLPHVHPMTVRQMDLGTPDVGALVLVEDLDRPLGLDAERIGSVFGLTAAQSRVAVLLVEGKSVPDIAALLGRAPSSVRTHVKGIHRMLGVSRRLDLIRLLLSVPGRAALRYRS